MVLYKLTLTRLSATYSAFCRNYGSHYTAAVQRYRSWNEEAIESMATQMETPWQNFVQSLSNFQAGIRDTIEGQFDQAMSQCKLVRYPRLWDPNTDDTRQVIGPVSRQAP